MSARCHWIGILRSYELSYDLPNLFENVYTHEAQVLGSRLTFTQPLLYSVCEVHGVACSDNNSLEPHGSRHLAHPSYMSRSCSPKSIGLHAIDPLHYLLDLVGVSRLPVPEANQI